MRKSNLSQLVVLCMVFAGFAMGDTTLKPEAGVNPLLSAQEIIFVVRPQYIKDHHNSATMFVTGEINTKSYRPGGIIKAIDFAHGGKVRTIFDAGPTGGIRDIEVSFDGKRILFSRRKSIS